MGARRFLRAKVLLGGLVVMSTFVACGGTDQLSIGQLSANLDVGFKVSSVMIRHRATEDCIISTDGSSGDEVVMDDCPDPQPPWYVYESKRSWEMEVMAVEDPPYGVWWRFKNRKSGFCITWVSGNSYQETTCGTGTSQQFWIVGLNDWIDTEIYAKSETNKRWKAVSGYVENVSTASSDIAWDIVGL